MEKIVTPKCRVFLIAIINRCGRTFTIWFLQCIDSRKGLLGTREGKSWSIIPLY